jgi:hypothetical protein
MKTISVITLNLALLIFAGMTLAGSEDIWGTWVNTEQPKGKYHHVAEKRVFSPDGMFKFYYYESSQSPEFEGTYAITERWTDSEGNIWYKMRATGKSIKYRDKVEWYLLSRISDSGKTLEYVYHPLDYHKKLDPNHPSYRILYRK